MTEPPAWEAILTPNAQTCRALSSFLFSRRRLVGLRHLDRLRKVPDEYLPSGRLVYVTHGFDELDRTFSVGRK
ncbi:MAG TPA: hypothetical protein VJH87_00030 [Vicinamibacteria bacterium]|nr:hypothetical protein [Vicinamibacteria bacterium]